MHKNIGFQETCQFLAENGQFLAEIANFWQKLPIFGRKFVKTATNSVHNIGLISMIRSENLKSIHRE
jgi:hypothetical protein